MKKQYPRKALAASQREARKRALRPPRGARPSHRMAEAIEKNTKHRCSAKHCFRYRRRIGIYCREHGARYSSSGDPIAGNIGPRMWRPFVLQAERFVTRHLVENHAAIAEAVRWITKELEASERPTRFDDQALLDYWSALLRVRRSGVEATELLARWIAGELGDARFSGDPGTRIASDTHARHQRARLLLFVKPMVHTWAKRKIEPQDHQGRVRLSWRVRSCAFERWNSALGLLALKATDAIRQQQH